MFLYHGFLIPWLIIKVDKNIVDLYKKNGDDWWMVQMTLFLPTLDSLDL